MKDKPFFETRIEELPVSVYPTNEALGRAAAEVASVVIQRAIRERGSANVILATGNSMLTFLAALRQDKEIAWRSVNIFHMDEYIGIDPNHPASFPNFLRQHILGYITPRAFYPVEGQRKDSETACSDYAQLLRAHPADLCALGIGENGHLAFNDPPFADFADPVWVKTVQLAEASRRQQVGEGHFCSMDECPTHAITLTIPALLSARRVLAIVPEARKAAAVKRALNGPISVDCPASILRRIPHAHLYLDKDSFGGSGHPSRGAGEQGSGGAGEQ
jgi:glucosamine-6-phosphate deaminase